MPNIFSNKKTGTMFSKILFFQNNKKNLFFICYSCEAFLKFFKFSRKTLKMIKLRAIISENRILGFCLICHIRGKGKEKVVLLEDFRGMSNFFVTEYLKMHCFVLLGKY